MSCSIVNSTDPTGGYVELDFVTEYYDHIFSNLEDTSFYVDLAQETGGPVLELASGSGRLTIPIAKSGVHITGLDLSDRMLSMCMSKLAGQPLKVHSRVELIKANMCSFSLGKKFPLVILPFSSFQYLLDPEDQLACLTSAAAHLEPGGTFVISVFNESIERLSDMSLFTEYEITPQFIMSDGRTVRRGFRWVDRNYTTQVETKESIFYVIHPDGRTERLVHRFAMRYFFQYELIHLLERAGLKTVEVYGGYDKSPFDAANREGRLIIVAKK